MPINGFLYPGAKFIPPYQVANSCRFDDGSSDFLNATNSTPTNNDKCTLSVWVKRSTLGGTKSIIGFHTDDNNRGNLVFDSDKLEVRIFDSGSTTTQLTTNQVFRDISAWYHIVLSVDTTQSTASSRVRIYVNGSEVTDFGTETNPSQNQNFGLNNSSVVLKIGQKGENNDYFDGYMAEFVFIDGQQLAPTSFGQFNQDSPTVWEPIDVTGLTFGNNGFYLDFEKDETSTNFIDRSSNARTITAAGNVHHSLDQAKFNDSSIEFDGSGDNLQVADSSDFDFGTGDFTFELFVYKQTSGKMSVFETRTYSGSGGEGFNLEFSSANKLEWYDSSLTADLPADPSAISLNTWTHYAVVRYNNVCTMYKNGTSVGTPKDVGSASQNSTRGPIIGEVENGDNDFDGYMDEIRLSNVARYTGNFTAPTSPFTSDSNTVLLIQSNASNKIGADVSGQGNHFESSGITSEDQSTDTCTNNYAVLNSILPHDTAQFSEGNLKITQSSTDGDGIRATIGVRTGKWYWEVLHGGGNASPGIATGSATTTDYIGSDANGFSYFINGNKYTGGSASSYGASFTTGDIIGHALDMDNNQITFYKNGSSQGVAFTSLPDEFIFPAISTSSVSSVTSTSNFGQDGSFAGAKTAQGNSDANGYGNFYYSVPSGYYAINTKNLAEFG